jgi:RNA polymerase sigma-70 factor (ECF subfamily)
MYINCLYIKIGDIKNYIEMPSRNKHKVSQEDVNRAIEYLKFGSAEAFHILYNKYYNDVYRFCLRMLGDSSVAKDAFQETFIRVYEHREEFKGENFAAWLFTIARNTCLNVLRTKRDHESFDEFFHTQEETNTEDIGLKDQIERAIAMLPPTYREALILREYNQLNYSEIAESLNIDVSLAKIRVFRARVILRKLLKPIRREIHES